MLNRQLRLLWRGSSSSPSALGAFLMTELKQQRGVQQQFYVVVMEAVALGSGLRFSGVCDDCDCGSERRPGFSFPEFLSGWSLVGWAPLSRVSLFDCWPACLQACAAWENEEAKEPRLLNSQFGSAAADSAMTTTPNTQSDKTTKFTDYNNPNDDDEGVLELRMQRHARSLLFSCHSTFGILLT